MGIFIFNCCNHRFLHCNVHKIIRDVNLDLCCLFARFSGLYYKLPTPEALLEMRDQLANSYSISIIPLASWPILSRTHPHTHTHL